MAPATQLAPIGLRTVGQIAPIAEGGHEGNGEPVARRLAQSGLVLHVVRQVRQGVALGGAALVGDGFVAAGEGYGLERKEGNAFRVVERELHDAAHLLVVDAVDDGDYRDDVHAVGIQVLDGAQFHVEKVAHFAMFVGRVADAVELQVGVAQAGVCRLPAELGALGELDSVGGRLHAGVAHFAGVGHGFQKVRRDGGLAAGELHAHLALRLDGDGVVKQRLDVFPAQLVDEADLVGVHEAGIAHHVAAIGQIDGQHRAASVGDGARAVMVKFFVVVGADVAAGEDRFQVLEESGIDGHDVFEVAVDGAILHHQDFAVALDHLRLDLAGFVGIEDLERGLAIQDLLADFRHAARTQRIGLARPAKRRHGLFPALEQRFVAPLGDKARVLADLVELIEDEPGRTGGVCQSFFRVFDGLVHVVPSVAKDMAIRALYQSIGRGRGGGPPIVIKMLKLLVVWHVAGLNGSG